MLKFRRTSLKVKLLDELSFEANFLVNSEDGVHLYVKSEDGVHFYINAEDGVHWYIYSEETVLLYCKKGQHVFIC